MFTLQTKLKMLWAVDPSDPATQPDPETLRELKSWQQKTDAWIYPCYVLNIPDVDWSNFGSVETLTRRFGDAKNATKALLEELGVSQWMQPPRVLVEHSNSIQNSVDRLISF